MIKPFDIVSAEYVDLSGKVKTFNSGDHQRGLFMVLFVDGNNIVCCKLTSHGSKYTNNCFLLMYKSHPFLHADSYVQIDKLQTFFADNLIKIGSVSFNCRPHLVKLITRLFGCIRVQLDDCLFNVGYHSPNMIPRHARRDFSSADVESYLEEYYSGGKK